MALGDNMARIIVGSYMVRYPLGGMLSWALQWLIGFRQLGHDVYFVEKSSYPNSCYDPWKDIMSDDCSSGVKTVAALLARFGLQDRWCFVDAVGHYHGLSRERVERIFRSADVFVDMGTHGAWLTEAADTSVRILVEGEPGYTQMKMEKRLAAGEILPEYDYYYSNGSNIGTDRSTAPTAGKIWRSVFNPVAVALFPPQPVKRDAPFTTVMNWQAHGPIDFNGMTYGQKDVEFGKFLNLPRLTLRPLELAVAGKNMPMKRLIEAGWRVRDAHAVTISFDAFWEYIRTSTGEFSVCKHAYVEMNSGWFSDRSTAYLASGRPVVLQDTGFSEHLPCGRGLFAVRTVDEAAAAIETISREYEQHAQWARDIAVEYLDSTKVLRRFLGDVGL
jgi:hypothetical protein